MIRGSKAQMGASDEMPGQTDPSEILLTLRRKTAYNKYIHDKNDKNACKNSKIPYHGSITMIRMKNILKKDMRK